MVPDTMPCSIIRWLLPFTLVLLLGLPTQGMEQFTSPPGPLRFLSKKDAQELWQRYQTAMVNDAAKANDLALNYWNQKFNTTFYRAPGDLTHILMETASGRIYHVVMNLVQVECPKDQTVNLQSCVMVPGTPKLVCKLAVIVFFHHDKAYISEEGCQEAPVTPPKLPEMTDNPPNYPYEQEEEGPVYI
uniref:Uncharacterized protein n=1 Tax=Sphaerodactylus townsendi TaxID=933632 RepID=A0ACB8G9A5_9SAUR